MPPPSHDAPPPPRRPAARRPLPAVPFALLRGLAACLGPPPAAAQPADTLRIPQVGADLAGLLWLPAGPAEAPWPAVILLPDRPGFDARGQRYAAQLAGAGLAALDLDIDPDAAAAAAALTAAAAVLGADGRFDPARIGVLGFGAGAALALAPPPGAAGAGDAFAARALLYPGCVGLLRAARRADAASPLTPVLLLHGDADAATPPRACAALEAGLAETAPVRRVQYRGAGYAWDRPGIGGRAEAVPRPDGPGRIPMAPWPELADLAAAQVAAFFAQALLGGGRGADGAAPGPRPGRAP